MMNITALKYNARIRLKRFHRNAVIVCLLMYILQTIAGSGGMRVNTTAEDARIDAFYDSYYEAMESGDVEAMKETIDNYKGILLDGIGLGMISSAMTASVMMVGILIMILRFVIDFFILNPLYVGEASFFCRSRIEPTKISEIAFAFNRDYYLSIVKTMFIKALKIALWTLLFIIPGIIKGLEYSMVPYIAAEYPEMSTREVFDWSRRMTYGYKSKIFLLQLSFIGWEILGMLTMGVLDILWVRPYMMTTEAELYSFLRGNITMDEESEYAF